MKSNRIALAASIRKNNRIALAAAATKKKNETGRQKEGWDHTFDNSRLLEYLSCNMKTTY